MPGKNKKQKERLTNFVHPELQKGEKLLTNISKTHALTYNRYTESDCGERGATDITFAVIQYETKRLGEVSYNTRTGEVIPNARPVFVQQTEYDRKNAYKDIKEKKKNKNR